jgi:hypothetical protein
LANFAGKLSDSFMLRREIARAEKPSMFWQIPSPQID